MTEKQLRAQMVEIARSLFARGYSFGTSGNLSARCGDGLLITPTGSSFETVAAAEIARISMDGMVCGPAKPSKEVPFHLAVYRARPDAGAVVHLHSTYAVAVSCLKGIDKRNALPVLTPYYAMRIGTLPVVPYLPPGDRRLGPEVERRARAARAILLQNHGPITADKDLPGAAALAEELEEQAKLYFLLAGRGRRLTLPEIAELQKRFGAR
jgi:ribulose-5-phosphate 4-epimerase/fuculose-1-phosphate aldolase